MTSNIPQARLILDDVRQGLLDAMDTSSIITRSTLTEWEKLLEDAQDLMTRSITKQRAPTKSRRVDATLAQEIRAYAASDPRLSVVEIAQHFDTNPGRVSEALNFLR